MRMFFSFMRSCLFSLKFILCSKLYFTAIVLNAYTDNKNFMSKISYFTIFIYFVYTYMYMHT